MDEKLTRLLYNLGLSANYSGFHYITTAVKIAAAEPLSLTMVTKWLYPRLQSTVGQAGELLRKISAPRLKLFG